MLIDSKAKKPDLDYAETVGEANSSRNSKDFRAYKVKKDMSRSNGSMPRFSLNSEVKGVSDDVNLPVVMRRRQTSENDFSRTDASESPNDQVGTAFFDYEANESDELSFQRGSVVEILDQNPEPGWIRARIGDNIGIIPKNYVRLIGSQLKGISGTQLKAGQSIGSGSWSEVYKGIYKKKDKEEIEVALKIPKDTTKSAVEITEALKQEAMIYARLSHKNVVGFYGICFDSPQCLVLELCHGGTLFNKLLRKLSYSIPTRAINWSIQIARGMEHLHTRDDALVHADLKADNVLIKENPCLCDHKNAEIDLRTHIERKFNGNCPNCGGIHLDNLTLKLTDFNISRAESEVRKGFEGSLPWMAPEVVRGSQHTKQSDVYSFGIVLWEVFTMEKPFFQSNTRATCLLIGNNETPSIPEDCPISVRRLMESCWNLTPKDRPTFTEIIKIMEDMISSPKPNADSTTILQYRNSDKLKIHAFKTIEETIEYLKKRSGPKNVYEPKTFGYHPKYLPAPEITKRNKKKKDKLNKKDIGTPMHFRCIMSVHDSQQNSKNSPREATERYLIESFSGESAKGKAINGSIASTLPRNHKHLSQTHLNELINYSDMMELTHGQKRNESGSYNNDHLAHINFGPPLKAAKSNPELAGPSSLSGKSSKRADIPLRRSNATRNRTIEPDVATFSKIIAESDMTSDLVDSAPIFRDTQERGRNQLDSGFATLPASLRSSSARAEKSKSKFYIDEEYNEFAQALNSQESPMSTPNKRPANRSRRWGLFKSNNSGTDLEADLLKCDRPTTIPCIHYIHESNSAKDTSHLCALYVSEYSAEVIMRPEPEIEISQFVASQSRQPNNLETRNTSTPFLKASEDPQWKRRIAGTVNNTGTLPLNIYKTGGRASCVSQVLAQRRFRQSTSTSENDESVEAPCLEVTPNACYEWFRPNSSSASPNYILPDREISKSPRSDKVHPKINDIVPSPSGSYSRLSSSNTRSITDLRPVGAGPSLNSLSAAEVVHQRSKSSDTQPHFQEDESMDWESIPPIMNPAYVLLSQSVSQPKNSAEEKAAPSPPPRYRPANLGNNKLPSTAPSLDSHSPSGNFRYVHQSPTEFGTTPSPHSNRRRGNNVLDREIIGMAESPTTTNRRNTPEPNRRYDKNGFVSHANSSSAMTSPMTPSTDDEIYTDKLITIQNPTYKSKFNANPTDMAAPLERAPPPPHKSPRYLPKKHNQLQNRPPF